MITFGQFVENKSTFRTIYEPNSSKAGTIVAYLGIKEVGYLSFYVGKTTADLEIISTHPEFRGHGVATRLVQAFVNVLKEYFPLVKSIDSEFLSRKALKAVNNIMGNPVYLGSLKKDYTKNLEKGMSLLQPDATEKDGELGGRSLNSTHRVPKRISKKNLRSFKPWITQNYFWPESNNLFKFTPEYEEDHGWHYINLMDGNKICAQLTWTISECNIDFDKPEELELYYIFVYPKYRGIGLGEYLLNLFKNKAKSEFPTATSFTSYVTWQGIYTLLNKVFGKPFLVMDSEKDEELHPDKVNLRKGQPKASFGKINYNKSLRIHYEL